MINPIVPILEADLVERYKPRDVWEGDDGNSSFRLVFDMIKGKLFGDECYRSTRFVDILVTGDIIMVQAQDRDVIRVNYHDPTSLDTIDNFINAHCLGTNTHMSKRKRMKTRDSSVQ